MKLFMRGLLALGLPALLTTVAFADAPAAPKAAAPATPTTPAATTPATAAQGNCGCSTDASSVKGGSSRKLFGGKIFRPVGEDRVGHAAQRYEEASGRIAGFFQHLAGPQVDPAPTAPGKGRGPTTQPGTVVFPQHPFARSPRDYFMQD